MAGGEIAKVSEVVVSEVGNVDVEEFDAGWAVGAAVVVVEGEIAWHEIEVVLAMGTLGVLRLCVAPPCRYCALAAGGDAGVVALVGAVVTVHS